VKPQLRGANNKMSVKWFNNSFFTASKRKVVAEKGDIIEQIASLKLTLIRSAEFFELL
jgi:hypothetical protein